MTYYKNAKNEGGGGKERQSKSKNREMYSKAEKFWKGINKDRIKKLKEKQIFQDDRENNGERKKVRKKWNK